VAACGCSYESDTRNKVPSSSIARARAADLQAE
jgi:hypothetical protein